MIFDATQYCTVDDLKILFALHWSHLKITLADQSTGFGKLQEKKDTKMAKYVKLTKTTELDFFL